MHNDENRDTVPLTRRDGYGNLGAESRFTGELAGSARPYRDAKWQGFLQAGFDDFIDKPFSFERVCQCLAEYLGTEFEYGEKEAVEGEAIDWSGVVVPAQLHARLREAAELYSVTELEGCFGELERLGEERLAGHLRGLRRRHDIEAILAVLQEVKHG